MRSFGLSIFATLALAVFSYAAPTPAGVPVNAIAARHDGEHTESNSLGVVLNVAIGAIKPITSELGCLTSETATLEAIGPLVTKLTDVVGGVIVKVNALVSLPLDEILCNGDGGVLGAIDIAGLLATILNLVFGACGSVLAVVSISIRVQVVALLAQVGCLVGNLICAVLHLVANLLVEIVGCLLPQIIGCLHIIVDLHIDVLIQALGL